MPDTLGFRRRSAMSTRKKAPKKSAQRPAKAIKRSPKSSSAGKSKDAKVSAKIVKPARPAKKAAAKTSVIKTSSAKASKVVKASSRNAAPAKAKALRSKSSRVAAAAKSVARAPAKTTKKKAVSAPKTQHSKRTSNASVRSAASRTQERVIVSAAKKKSQSEKKGQDRLSVTGHAKIIESKPVAAVRSPIKLNEPPKVVAPPAAVVGLETVAASRPIKAPIVEKPAALEAEEPVVPKVAKTSAPRHGFKTSEFIVYPAHGVGQIVAVEEQEVAGFKLELFVITFVKDKMTLRVPTGKVTGVGMRKLAEPEVVKRALDILLGRARIKRTMWSRRAQEYETKINSGDLAAISEVVRDLYRSEAQPEQSYSERQLYEAALDRMAREVAVVQKLTESEALKAIDAQLQKGQRRGAKVEADAAAPGAGDSDVEEAA
jgi:CarD family transcriptional regulator